MRGFRFRAHHFGMEFTRRRLPHWRPEDKWLFVTWHLHGSLPAARFPPPGKVSSGKAFVWIDRYLDTTRTGPHYLERADVARIVIDSMLTGEGLGHYSLGPFAVMSNHVHLLLLPRVGPSRLLQSLKGASAREADRLLGRTGHPFWQAESYDHWVRNDREWTRIGIYIEQNPVRARYVTQAEDYPWSSAYSGNREC